ncbi:MAG TPA: EamA family transporter [Abditibacteriaceae bacterium]|jgi:transporter family protein
MWIPLALFSAFLTAAVGTMSKAGLEKVSSTFGFAIQSTVIVTCAWLVVFLKGNLRSEVASLETKTLGLLAASGVVSCLAYLCYFGALSTGDSSRVQPVDRLSLVFAIVLAAMFLRERTSPPVLIGAGLMTLGALVIAFSPTSK